MNGITRKESIAALLYLPLHMLAVPWVLGIIARKTAMGSPELNFIRYAAGAVYMLIFLGGLLRRDFDTLCDRPVKVLFQVAGSYMISLFATAAVGLLLGMFLGGNLNNEAVIETAEENRGMTVAAAVFLAPLVEEPIFRAGVYGTLKKKNRALAAAVSIAAFSLYHVIYYVGENPVYLLYALQYVPASALLISCYEQTGTLWSPIFLHMLINAVSMGILERL